MSISLRYALDFCAAVGLLAGCSAANVTPSRGNGLGSNSNWATLVATDGLANRRGKHRETLLSTGGSGGISSCFAGLSVSGKAFGPSPGTFTGGGWFKCLWFPFNFWGRFQHNHRRQYNHSGEAVAPEAQSRTRQRSNPVDAPSQEKEREVWVWSPLRLTCT